MTRPCASALLATALLYAAAGCGGSDSGDPTCPPSVTADPTSLIALHQARTVYTGKCFTPGSAVQIAQVSGWLATCRGIIIVPGTTMPVGGDGTFSFKLPNTALSQTAYVGPGTMEFTDVSGKSAPPITLDYVDHGAEDTLVVPGSPGSPLSAVATGETGSGTIVAQGFNTRMSGAAFAFREDVVVTLHGAPPNRTYNVFMKALGLCAGPGFGTKTTDLQVGAYGTVTTDATGNATASFRTYTSTATSAGYFDPIVSLTSDANLPGASNVAYQGTITVLNPFDQSVLQ